MCCEFGSLSCEEFSISLSVSVTVQIQVYQSLVPTSLVYHIIERSSEGHNCGRLAEMVALRVSEKGQSALLPT